MKPRTRPWYLVPIVILTIGIVCAAIVFIQYLGKNDTNSANTPTKVNKNAASGPSCGNGICEDVACLSTNCPQPESESSCPEDCSVSSGGSDSGIVETNTNARSTNENVNVSVDDAYVLDGQSLDQKRLCPIEDANLNPEHAVAIALRSGLSRGTQPLSVSLYQYEKPLDQCVWSVKSYTTATSGTVYTIIDATQEVFDSHAWKG